MSLPYFMDIVTQTEYTLPPTNLYTGERTIYTTNKMMDKNEPVYYEPYIEGIKTGSHDEAGYCLVTTAQKNGQRYMIVALGAPIGDVHGEMLDTKNLYDWAFQGFQESSPVLAHNVYPEIKRGQLWDKMNTVSPSVACLKCGNPARLSVLEAVYSLCSVVAKAAASSAGRALVRYS